MLDAHQARLEHPADNVFARSRHFRAMQGHASPKCFSGIVVTTTADRLAQVATALGALPGVQVRHAEPERLRLIIVQEAGTIEGELKGMQRMRALPGVVDASLVFHMFDDAAEPA